MNRSESIKELAAALSKAQAVMKNAAKDHNNPHFGSRFADLASVWDACREPLTANGLAVLQPASAHGKSVTIETTLVHASGEWVAETLALEARDASPQSVGSAITYGRRYGLSAMVGICPDDDDGEAATDHARPQAHAARPPAGARTRPAPAPAKAPPPPAAKHDDRPFSTLVSDELERRHREYREEHPDAREVLNAFEAHRHMLKAAVLEKRTGDPGQATDGKVRQVLGELYRRPEYYGPMRKELSAYLSAKFREAHERATLEERGDPDMEEVKAAADEPDAGARG